MRIRFYAEDQYAQLHLTPSSEQEAEMLRMKLLFAGIEPGKCPDGTLVFNNNTTGPVDIDLGELKPKGR